MARTVSEMCKRAGLFIMYSRVLTHPTKSAWNHYQENKKKNIIYNNHVSYSLCMQKTFPISVLLIHP